MPDINVEEYYKRQSEQERELEKLITKEEHLNEQVDDLITRIRSLEKQVWGAGAVLTAFIVIGGVVGDLDILPNNDVNTIHSN